MGMRPVRDYWHVFTHPLHESIEVPGSGVTPCKAKSQAFERLQREVRERGLPDNDWRLVRQTQLSE